MERVESLINKLSVQFQARSSVAELLATTELLRAELSRNGVNATMSSEDSVAVWLPAGYTSLKVAKVEALPVNGYHKPLKENKAQEEPNISVIVAKTSPVPPQ